jgi:CBS domain-containing protein
MGDQWDLSVVDEAGEIVGVLTREQLMSALSHQGRSGTVDRAMTTTFETVDAREMRDAAYGRLQQRVCPVLPVLDGGRVVGLLTEENVPEYVMIRSAWRRADGSSAKPVRCPV